MFILSLLAAFAQDVKFEGTAKDGASIEKPESKLTAELGGTWVTGNSEFYSLGSGVNGSHRWKRSKFQLIGGGVFGSARVDADGNGTIDDVERSVPMIANARRVFGDVRYDFFLSGRDSLYVLAGAFHDPFAGFKLRAHEQFGYSRALVKTDDTTLVGEFGIDWAQELFVDGVDPASNIEIVAGRVLIGLSHKFNESVGFQNTFEIYENVLDFEDLRILNKASLVSALSGKLSLKLSHALIFDNVPVEGFRKLDQTFQVTFVASIL